VQLANFCGNRNHGQYPDPDEGCFAMVARQDRFDRHEQLFMGAKKKNRHREEDPRKAKYAKLVARTAKKYEDIAKSRGVPVKPEEENVKK
jgi:hypothetical protein